MFGPLDENEIDMEDIYPCDSVAASQCEQECGGYLTGDCTTFTLENVKIGTESYILVTDTGF